MVRQMGQTADKNKILGLMVRTVHRTLLLVVVPNDFHSICQFLRINLTLIDSFADSWRIEINICVFVD